jgi:DNA-directed RNA polymerase subunit RPC12/RpoP
MGGAFKCPGCGETTWGALDCCPKCGESIFRKCSACGRTWRYIYRDEYQFCPTCGTRVEPVKLER